MIIPVGINHVIRGWPRVTIALIAICTLVHIYAEVWAPSPDDVTSLIRERIRDSTTTPDADWQVAVAEDAEQMLDRIPIVRLGHHTDHGPSWRLFTAAFVHGGWLHLIGNMLFLWLAGAALEDRWGRLRFAGFYLAGAAASTLFFDALYTGPPTILVGASGAISALMGAFLVFFARMQIHFAYWFWLSVGTFSLVAYVALPLWFAEQLLSAWLLSDLSGVSDVAFTAHIGGFVFGLVIAAIVKLATRGRDAAESDDEAAPAPARLPTAVAARRRRDPPPPKADAPKADAPKLEAPKLEAPKIEPPKPPPGPRDPNDGPTFLS